MDRIIHEFWRLVGIGKAELRKGRRGSEIALVAKRRFKSDAGLLKRLAKALERRGFEIERAKYDAASRRHPQVVKLPGALWITAKEGNKAFVVHTPKVEQRDNAFLIMGSEVNKVHNSQRGARAIRGMLRHYAERR